MISPAIYAKLKRKRPLSEDEKKQIQRYEEHQDQWKKTAWGINYLKAVNAPSRFTEFSDANELFGKFKPCWEYTLKKPFEKTQQVIDNIKPVFQYFAKDPKFGECPNVYSSLSKPSLDKGLLIVGGVGVGKTSTMRILQKVLNCTNNQYGYYSSNQVVQLFEACSNQESKTKFWDSMLSGVKYFDDLKREPIAMNYGTIDLFNRIIADRYERGLKTHISCNYDHEFPENVEKALYQFGVRYGDHIYDRLFEMFNIVEFNGKSMRK